MSPFEWWEKEIGSSEPEFEDRESGTKEYILKGEKFLRNEEIYRNEKIWSGVEQENDFYIKWGKKIWLARKYSRETAIYRGKRVENSKNRNTKISSEERKYTKLSPIESQKYIISYILHKYYVSRFLSKIKLQKQYMHIEKDSSYLYGPFLTSWTHYFFKKASIFFL
jgi:hypothetical protein